jgi:polyribonucleotide nucleotidyltransferase
MAKFKQVKPGLKVSTFQEMDSEQVEDEVLAAVEEGKKRIAELEAEKAELEEKLAEATKPWEPPKVNRATRRFINELRQQDTPKINKTCACCTRRCSVPDKMSEHEDFCIKCLGR